MVYLDINTMEDKNPIEELNKHLKSKNSKIFILFYMNDCGPCNATRPEWSKIKNVLSKTILKDPSIAIAAVNKDLANQLVNITSEPRSFPTIRFITDAGKTVENYEDSNIKVKDRSIDSFIEWINAKASTQNRSSTKKHHKRSQTGGKTRTSGKKWSRKYKKSINCRRPKGFSQRQYCKYGRK